jgi:uncharacterized membrane protein YccC
VIAAFITFMGVNNSGEQARKGLFRIAGTVVGIGIGSLLVTAVGHHAYWSIAVILASLFLGFYLMRVNYTFMVVGITVTVSQLYPNWGSSPIRCWESGWRRRQSVRRSRSSWSC